MDSVMQIEYLLDSPASRYLTFLKHSEKRRKQWVRPYFKSRLNNGEFARCYKEPRENATQFFEYTRMAPFTFDYILNHVRRNLHLLQYPLYSVKTNLIYLGTYYENIHINTRYEQTRQIVSNCMLF
uniref:Uncharacterized protein n=1 Tax=Cacopsylla melanoneura TaxID=428564 RepID=A0A8D8XC41_9HEMI